LNRFLLVLFSVCLSSRVGAQTSQRELIEPQPVVMTLDPDGVVDTKNHALWVKICQGLSQYLRATDKGPIRGVFSDVFCESGKKTRTKPSKKAPWRLEIRPSDAHVDVALYYGAKKSEKSLIFKGQLPWSHNDFKSMVDRRPLQELFSKFILDYFMVKAWIPIPALKSTPTIVDCSHLEVDSSEMNLFGLFYEKEYKIWIPRMVGRMSSSGENKQCLLDYTKPLENLFGDQKITGLWVQDARGRGQNVDLLTKVFNETKFSQVQGKVPRFVSLSYITAHNQYTIAGETSENKHSYISPLGARFSAQIGLWSTFGINTRLQHRLVSALSAVTLNVEGEESTEFKRLNLVMSQAELGLFYYLLIGIKSSITVAIPMGVHVIPILLTENSGATIESLRSQSLGLDGTVRSFVGEALFTQAIVGYRPLLGSKIRGSLTDFALGLGWAIRSKTSLDIYADMRREVLAATYGVGESGTLNVTSTILNTGVQYYF
jgi:hypothetical protein